MKTGPGYSADRTAIIVLAAGSSTRLGRPKQLLEYAGETLLQHTVNAAVEAKAGPVVVVAGARAGDVKSGLQGQAQVVVNNQWKEGMASSIRCGIQTLIESKASVEGAILMVCDQPFVTASLLNELLTAHHKTHKRIVTCSYANTFGPPVYFHQTLFADLLRLKGDTGARGVIRQYANEVEAIPFDAGRIDIDTEIDYRRLTGEKTD